jgi:hypothetical protein
MRKPPGEAVDFSKGQHPVRRHEHYSIAEPAWRKPDFQRSRAF